MGSDDFYPEEGPVHEVSVENFEISRYAVTNQEFARFVAETGYVTTAERAIDPRSLGNNVSSPTQPGSLVFFPTDGPVNLSDWRLWWRWVPGANWRHPRGPESDISGLLDHPVVQVSIHDASAYCSWVGGRLPSEKEWEFAARGGLDSATFSWGDEPNNGLLANTWQGEFPFDNKGARGWVYTAPVGSFPENGYGLHEMTGNTWEWTSTEWTTRHTNKPSCCPQHEPKLPGQVKSYVLKGGSHLCSPSYCLRYRPAARSAQSDDSATTHIGFRVARSKVSPNLL